MREVQWHGRGDHRGGERDCRVPPGTQEKPSDLAAGVVTFTGSRGAASVCVRPPAKHRSGKPRPTMCEISGRACRESSPPVWSNPRRLSVVRSFTRQRTDVRHKHRSLVPSACVDGGEGRRGSRPAPGGGSRQVPTIAYGRSPQATARGLESGTSGIPRRGCGTSGAGCPRWSRKHGVRNGSASAR